MKRVFVILLTLSAVAALACTTTGCTSAPKAYDEQFCVRKNDKGQCTEWTITPPKRATRSDTQFVSRPAI